MPYSISVHKTKEELKRQHDMDSQLSVSFAVLLSWVIIIGSIALIIYTMNIL